LRTARHRAGFTLQDLLALLAAVAILAALHVPSLGSHRIATHRVTCLDNLRQLIRAWIVYVEDFDGRLPGNQDSGIAMNLANTNLTWAIGWLSLDSERTDNTNWVAVMNSQLGPYTRSPDLYRCPADVSVGPVPGGQQLPRVRSISMNSYVGDRSGPYTAGYWQFRRLAEIIDPSPARLFVFIDEREDGINDACFFVDMTGYRPPTLSPDSYRLVDYPADRHHRGANLAFADGHTETWRWQDPRTTPPQVPGRPLPLNQASPHNPDVARIQAVTSRRMIP
jgi:prepilin-type processing-associated H-X9-DG protein